MLPFLIAGLTIGSVYSLAGVGLVLTYKTSKLFNFAHGALATISAYLFYTLHVQHGMPWPLAAVLCVLVAGPVLGLAFELIARIVAVKSVATRVVTTVQPVTWTSVSWPGSFPVTAGSAAAPLCG